MNPFFEDVWRGLNETPRRMYSKYFYDGTGDRLFQEIMACPEYYPTRCELEIFSQQTDVLISTLQQHLSAFDVVELGAGDATKSRFLLEGLLRAGVDFTYLPIDISANVIRELESSLPETLPGLKVRGLQGEYFPMLEQAAQQTERNRVVLFLGSNIGNIPVEETGGFLKELRSHLQPGDLLLIGYDLIKEPGVILAAYNDAGGITRRFNLNLLDRINRELGANFDTGAFIHFPFYNPVTGACKSYLVSTRQQQVCIGPDHCITLEAHEPIFMEISQKYTVEHMSACAVENGFQPLEHIYDSRQWFVDAIWKCV
jgi:dimethylhistidine N-methyltransferase